MVHKRETRSITAKVAAGFLVLFIIIGAAIFLLLSQSEKTKPLRQAAEVAGAKANLVNGMLSRLLEMDRLARAYYTSRNFELLDNYLQNFELLKREIETLKEGNDGNKQQRARIKRVDTLIGKKQVIHEKLFGLKRQLVVDTTTRDTILNMAEQLSDTIQTSRTILQVHTIERIPVRMPEAPKKDNLLKRMWNSITGTKPIEIQVPPLLVYYETKKDTSIIYSIVSDTTALLLKNQLIDYRQKELTISQEISEQEKHLQKTDQQIANEIRRLLFLIEHDQLKLSDERAQQSTDIQDRLYLFSIALGVVALLTILLFSLFIWRDLTRSEYYKKELETARLVAEEHLRVKEQFLATMSHEIRTPITSIIGFAEQLGKTNLDPQQINYQAIITQSSEHLLGLVNDILDFSKIEAGMLHLETVPFYPQQAVTDAWNLIHQKGIEKGLTMHCDLNFPENMRLSGDPLRLRQIVINLLGNAIKFTEHGKVTLKATTEQVGSKKIKLTIFVSDTGIGIPKEMQEAIFKEFTQSDLGVTRRFGGTGLGLAICKRLVEMQGGSLGVNSIPTKGSEFYVSLPFEPNTEEVQPQMLKTEIAPPSYHDVTILLVDDDSLTLLLTKSILEKYGAKVITAVNGKEALTTLKQHESVSLLISDINMPEMSGPELIAEIRKDETYKGIHALCTSATSASADIQQFLTAGFDAVLTKPFHEQDLIDKLAPLLGKTTQFVPSISIKENGANYSFLGIKQFTGDDEQAYKAILQSLIENLTQALEQIPSNAEKNEQKQLAELAHKLIPHFHHLGMVQGVTLLSKIELFRKESTKDLAYFQKQAEEFRVLINNAIGAIEKELG
ncbi:ATP-binding protein [Williamwhitmania taraxaci]|uniref:histidine kinase n=1 Tax=Williamwhitmania taraxaci TaxID=1640674 RepID=A0A1G6LIL5_9BACT|nr:ATP-binding protein [Williamwhitmania taraxaci]SDC43014.1 Signal transduction histidine kinase [Williamwhitmania taraxaci]